MERLRALLVTLGPQLGTNTDAALAVCACLTDVTQLRGYVQFQFEVWIKRFTEALATYGAMHHVHIKIVEVLALLEYDKVGAFRSGFMAPRC